MCGSDVWQKKSTSPFNLFNTIFRTTCLELADSFLFFFILQIFERTQTKYNLIQDRCGSGRMSLNIMFTMKRDVAVADIPCTNARLGQYWTFHLYIKSDEMK